MSDADNRSKKPSKSIAWVKLSELVRNAFGSTPDAESAYEEIRRTYETKTYHSVWPTGIFKRDEKPGAEGEKEGRYYFLDGDEGRCFVRNLWFLQRFFRRPKDVIRFLNGDSSSRQKQFHDRCEEIRVRGETYLRWSASEGRIVQALDNFKSTETDLEALAPVCKAQTETELRQGLAGSPAVADFIREVEERASYRAGNPDDACEKALYFLALGRLDIAHRIASEVLAENQDHAVALYANAVLLLDAGVRHRQQASVHDVLHPHDLPPLDAEEFHHADRHAEESLRAQEKETQAFLLMLKARQNWPEQFTIKCYNLSPSVWQYKVDEWLFSRAAARVGEDWKELRLPSSAEAKGALKALTQIVSDTWAKGAKYMFNPLSSAFLRNFIIVATRVEVNVARNCVKKLEAALDQPKPEEIELPWRGVEMVLPISPDLTLAETLIPAAKDSLFSCVIFATRPEGEAAALLCRIAQTGLADEHDRRTALRSLAMREVVLNMVHGGASAQAVELCREMAERRDWPATATGEKMQACWQYAVIVLLFESSRAAFEDNNIQAAAERVALALQQATNSLEAIAGEKPLVKFIESDEYDDREVVRDFLRRQPNIVTEAGPSDVFPAPGKWRQWPGHKACWDDFVKWSEGECPPGTPLLLAYGYWLARQHGQRDLLLPRCDALAARIRPCPK